MLLYSNSFNEATSQANEIRGYLNRVYSVIHREATRNAGRVGFWGLILLSILTRLWELQTFPEEFGNEFHFLVWAETIHLGEPAQILEGTTISDWVGLPYPISPSLPYFPWLVSISFSLFSRSIQSGRLVSAIAGVVACLVIFLLSSELYNKETGVICLLLVAISPYHIFFSRVATPSSSALLFCLFSLLFFVRWVKTANSRYLIFSSLFFGISLGFSLEAFFLIIPSLVYLYSYLLKKNGANISTLLTSSSKTPVKLFLLSSVAMLAGCFPVILYFVSQYPSITRSAILFCISIAKVSLIEGIIPIGLSLLEFLWFLLTPYVFVVCLIGIPLAAIRHDASDVLLLSWPACVFLCYLILGYGSVPDGVYLSPWRHSGWTVWYHMKTFWSLPRYILPSVPPILILGSNLLLRTVGFCSSRKELLVKLTIAQKKKHLRFKRARLLFLSICACVALILIVGEVQVLQGAWDNQATIPVLRGHYLSQIGVEELSIFLGTYDSGLKRGLTVVGSIDMQSGILWYTRGRVNFIALTEHFVEHQRYLRLVEELPRTQVLFVFRGYWDTALRLGFLKAFPDQHRFMKIEVTRGGWTQTFHIFLLSR